MDILSEILGECGKLHTIDSMSSFKELINGDKPVLVDFSAEWCGPCKSLQPILKEVARQLKDSVRIIKIDVDKNQELSQKLQIQGVPTLILYKDGAPLWRQSGVIPAQQLVQIIQSHSL